MTYATPPTGINLGLLGVGILVTRLASHDAFGSLALLEYLKTRLHFNAVELSGFLATTAVALCAKPFLALLMERMSWRDVSPRDCILCAGLLGAAAWSIALTVATSKALLLSMLLLASAANVCIAVILDGALAVEGRRSNRIAHISAIRKCGFTVALMLGSLISGLLASGSLHRTCAVGIALMLGLAAGSRCLPATTLGRHMPLDDGPDEPRPAFREGAGKLGAAVLMTGLFSIAPAFDTLLVLHRRDVLGFSPTQIGTLKATNEAACLISALCYPLVAARMAPRTRLSLGILAFAASLLVYLPNASYASSFIAEIANGLIGMFCLVALQELAVRGAPRGHEMLGVACVVGVGGVAYRLSDVLGTHIAESYHLSLREMIVLCASASASTFLVVPLLPPSLFGDVARSAGEMSRRST